MTRGGGASQRGKQSNRSLPAPMVPVFLFAAVGILTDAFLHPGALFWTILTLVFLSSALGIGFFAHRKEPDKTCRHRVSPFSLDEWPLASVLVSGVVASAFGLWHDTWQQRYPADEFGFLIPPGGSPVIVEGIVAATPFVVPAPTGGFDSYRVGSARTFFPLRVLRTQSANRWRTVSGTVQVAFGAEVRDLCVGETIRAAGIAYHPTHAKNPGDSDPAIRLRQERILTQITIDRPEALQRLPTLPRWPVRSFFDSLRRAGDALFATHLSPENAPLASAMLLGRRDRLDEETQSHFRETGTGHLLAISGLHVAIVTGFFFLLYRFLGFGRRTLAILLAITALFYLGMTDMRPPAIRATVLVLFACGGLFLRRASLSVNSLCAAAVALLILNPTNLFQAGAHLSFLATGVFLWFRRAPLASKIGGEEVPRVSRRRWTDTLLFRFRSRPVVYLLVRETINAVSRIGKWTILSTTIWFVILPYALHLFGLAAPVALLINPLLIFPMTLALVSGLVLLGVGWIPVLGGWIGLGTNGAFSLFRWGLIAGHSIPGGRFESISPPSWWCLGFYLPLIFWTLLPDTRPRLRAILLLAAGWCAVGWSVEQGVCWNDRRTDRLRVDFLSVGHGAASLLVFSDGRTALLDCGSFGSPQTVARRVKRALRRHRRTQIDLVILSHADADHYNGLVELLETVRVKTVAVSPSMFAKPNAGLSYLQKRLDAASVPIHVISATESLAEFGFSELAVLHPDGGEKNPPASTNAESLVVVVTHYGRRILFPGDLDTHDAAFLRTAPVPFDLLVAPHHGGKSENYHDLLAWGRPRVVVISGGLFTRNIASEEQLRHEGFMVLHTFDCGAVLIEITRGDSPPLNAPGMMTLRTVLP